MSGTTATTSSSTNVSSSAAANPLSSLTSNFQSFLSMLTTQLQNQDPTAPMDSSQFTTELVQFTGVEAQIQGNASLTQLITLGQNSSVMQSAQLVGKQAQATSNQLTLQNGSAAIAFTAASVGPVSVTVSNGAGQVLASSTINATAGSNGWTWNGQSSAGVQEPDGAYTVSVTTGSSQTALPVSVVGTITAVTQNNGTVQLDLGQLAVDMSAVTSVQ